ncbi:Ig-like domain-containing protein, partial [Cocleimonas sp. KMM 6892]|uniref:SdrD B-like domain-containing protein n=3 Tax=unclassified Cocleimonas TaxID=2639732 RepID=UPI002DB7B347
PVAVDDSQANPGVPSPTNPTTLATIGANDSDPDGNIDPATVDLDPATPGIQSTLTNADGTYTADAAGNVTFTPNASLTGNPTAIPYTINDNDGNTSNTATLTVTYGTAPVAVDDSQANPGVPSPTNPTTLATIGANDSDPDGNIDPATVDLNTAVDGIQNTITILDGTWEADLLGNVTFTPNASLTGNPTPILYTIQDNEGNTSNQATLTVTYGNEPTANDDVQANPGVPSPANPTTLPLVGNNDSDSDGIIDPATVDLDPATPGIQSTLTNADGTYTADASGNVTFTPNASLTGNPTPISYTVNDNDGNTSNEATLTVTYGTTQTGTVNGIVYEDTNGNGTQDSGEFGISGVNVLITDSEGNTQTLTTDTSGNYSTSVVSGSTTINIQENTLPGGSTQTEGTDPTVVIVPVNDVASDIDGYQPADNSGEIIGIVYADTNSNGMQDANEPGIAGVQVIVTDSEGNTQTVTTDSDGTYGATVPAGATTIDVVDSSLPSGSVQTEGTDTTTVTVPANGTATDRDGFNTPIVTPLFGTVQGVVYLDANNNGQQDNGETGITNVRVTITDSSGAITTVITNSNGLYSQSVIAGSTTIDISDSDINSSLTRSQGSDPTVVNVIAGSVANDIDGFAPPQPKPPVAVDDSKQNQPLGQAVTVNTVSNDSDPDNNLDPTTVKLRDPSGNPVTSLIVEGEGTWSVNITTGDITFTPEAGFMGDPTPVDYTVKDTTGLESNVATVTVDYEEPAAITGTVWLDRDKDNVIDSNEDRKAGWTLKIKDKDGNIVATTVTDSQGNYSVTGLVPAEYTVEFFNTKGTLIATQTTGGPLVAGQTVNLPLPVDPSGVIYDSTTRELIAGVTLQLVNSQGVPVDAACVGEGQQNQVTAEDGLYAFDVYPNAHSSCQNGETYTIKIVSAPAGYYTNSTIIPPQTGVYDSDSNETNCTRDAIANSGSCEVQGQPDAPQGNQDTTYFMDFSLNSGDSNVIFNHIPLDSEIARQTEIADDTILISKSANKNQVSVGDQLYYTITAENMTEDEIEVDVRDDLPKGFKFASSAAKLTRAGEDNNFGTDDDIVTTIKATGTDPISFNSLIVKGNEKIKIGYILKVGTSVSQGNAVNSVQVFASGSDDDIASNVAIATVAVVVDSVFDQSTLIGKVFHDRDGDGYQDPANATGITVKSDYFGWNSLHLGGLNGRVSVLDDPDKYRKVILMPYSKKNDFKVTTQQGTVITVDNRGQATESHIGQKAKGLTAQDLRISTRRIKGIPTATKVKSMRVPGTVQDVLEITITNYGIQEEGIPGVRLATVEGLLIETDGYGRYHIPDVDGGRRGSGKNFILKVDTATLPEGAKFTTENPRVLRLSSTALNKINFGIKLPVQDAPVRTIKSPAKYQTQSRKRTITKQVPVYKTVEVGLGSIFFDKDKHNIRADQRGNMDLLVSRIKRHGKGHITINAYTDSRHTAQYNIALANRRADTVRQELQKRLGSTLMRQVKVVVDKSAYQEVPHNDKRSIDYRTTN